jgi:hypothetical protein
MPDGSCSNVPVWMFDKTLCSAMKLGSPCVSLRALLRLRLLLAELRSDQARSAAAAEPQEPVHAATSPLPQRLDHPPSASVFAPVDIDPRVCSPRSHAGARRSAEERELSNLSKRTRGGRP